MEDVTSDVDSDTECVVEDASDINTAVDESDLVVGDVAEEDISLIVPEEAVVMIGDVVVAVGDEEVEDTTTGTVSAETHPSEPRLVILYAHCTSC